MSDSGRQTEGVELAPRPFPAWEEDGGAIHVEHIPARPRVFYHYHETCELVFVGGGAGTRIVGDDFTDYAGRDLVLVGPELPHGWTTDPAVADAGRDFAVVVLFTKESLGLEFLAKPEMRGVDELIDASARGIAFAPEVVAELEPEFVALPGLRPGRQLLAFLEILDRLVASESAREVVSADYNPSDLQREHALLGRVLEFIHDRYAEPIALADVADHVHMSVSTFTRFFKRMTGTTFVSYLNEWRIRRACTLLAETDRRVVDVAMAVGFHNLSHFNREFKRRRGTTPSGYRKEA